MGIDIGLDLFGLIKRTEAFKSQSTVNFEI